MSMSYEIARMRIGREIQDVEASLDEALIKQANLLAALVTVRRETGSAPAEGHEVLLRLHKSQQALLSSGGDLARVHSRLLEIQKENGRVHNCPPAEGVGEMEPLSKSA